MYFTLQLEIFNSTALTELLAFKSQKHVMFTMGDDFSYQNAAMYYKQLDKLVRYTAERSEQTGIKAVYSTPSCYIKALNDEIGIEEWPTKTDDFFPYASGNSSLKCSS